MGNMLNRSSLLVGFCVIVIELFVASCTSVLGEDAKGNLVEGPPDLVVTAKEDAMSPTDAAMPDEWVDAAIERTDMHMASDDGSQSNACRPLHYRGEITNRSGACSQSTADCNHDLSDGCEADLTNDVFNCGGCGITCGRVSSSGFYLAEESCNRGLCDAVSNSCAMNEVLCLPDFECRDVLNDPGNCGGCNCACAPGQACVAGRCE